MGNESEILTLFIIYSAVIITVGVVVYLISRGRRK